MFAKWLTYQATNVAITSTCTMKLECFDKTGTPGKRNFEQIFIDGFSVYKRNNYLLTKFFRETMVSKSHLSN